MLSKDEAVCFCHKRECHVPAVHLFACGFSCKSVSKLNHHHQANGSTIRDATQTATNITFTGAMKYIHRRQPWVVLFENVEGIMQQSAKGDSNKDWVLKTLQEEGYYAEAFLTNSCDHGTPQNRLRCYFLAVHVKNPNLCIEAETIVQKTIKMFSGCRLQPPSLHDLLLPDDSSDIAAVLQQRKDDRDAEVAKASRKAAKAHAKAKSKSKIPVGKQEKWIELHIDQCAKHRIRWPLELQVRNEWTETCTQREQQVIAFYQKSHKDLVCVDVYHSLHRAATSCDPYHIGIVLPSTRLWLQSRGRLAVAKELLRLQCIPWPRHGEDLQLSEAALGDLAGNAFCGGTVAALMVSLFSQLDIDSYAADADNRSQAAYHHFMEVINSTQATQSNTDGPEDSASTVSEDPGGS